MDTPGFEVVRDVPNMHHHAPEEHCEIVMRDVRVPADAMLCNEGDGFMLAQARLGPAAFTTACAPPGSAKWRSS